MGEPTISARDAALLAHLGRDWPVVEIGASYNPLAPRSAGWRTTNVDHDTREALVEKYRHAPNVDVSRIEEVDHIWHGGRLHDLFPAAQHGTFRAVIASHVIEHLPDPLGFLDSCARLLDPAEGVVVLAVPDKRWCFDALKPWTTTGQWLNARAAGAARHSPGVHFDDVARASTLHGRIGWAHEPLDALALAHPLEAAIESWRSATPDGPYRDAHTWHFTPASFELLLVEATAAGACDWHLGWIAPQPAIEFLAVLHRGPQPFASPEARDAHRLDLLRRILIEQREQIDWMAPRPVLSAIPAAATGWPERAWHGLLPLRRKVARWRGRIP